MDVEQTAIRLALLRGPRFAAAACIVDLPSDTDRPTVVKGGEVHFIERVWGNCFLW